MSQSDPTRLTESVDGTEELELLQSGVRMLRRQNGTLEQTEALASRLGPQLASNVVASESGFRRAPRSATRSAHPRTACRTECTTSADCSLPSDPRPTTITASGRGVCQTFPGRIVRLRKTRWLPGSTG